MRWLEQAHALPEGGSHRAAQGPAELAERAGPRPGNRQPPGMVPQNGNPPPKKKVTVAEEAVSGAWFLPKVARVRPVVPGRPIGTFNRIPEDVSSGQDRSLLVATLEGLLAPASSHSPQMRYCASPPTLPPPPTYN